MSDSPFKFTPAANPDRRRRATMRTAAPIVAGEVRRAAREAALSDFEEEGRKALREHRAARAPRPQMKPMPSDFDYSQLSPEERREVTAPLTAEELARQERNYKKGGSVKGGKWIQGAIKKPGALRSQLGVKAGQKIPAKKLASAAKAPGKLGQRARLAQTLSKMKGK